MESNIENNTTGDSPPPADPGTVRIDEAAAASSNGITRSKQVAARGARDLGFVIYKYVRRHLPPTEAPPVTVDEPPRAPGGMFKLRYLRIVPWVLALVFATSFVWDFAGVAIQLAGYSLAMEGLLRVLSVSGLIGFFTNWLAISMLFKPRQRRPIFGQGLIPAQRDRVIFRLAQAISQELINEEVIKRKIEESGAIQKYRETALAVSKGVLEDPEFRREVKVVTQAYIDDVLQAPEVRQKLVDLTIAKVEQYAGSGLGGLALKMYRIFKEEEFVARVDAAIRELPSRLDSVLDEMDLFLDKLPARIEARSDDIERWATRVILGFVETLNVYEMITENMKQFDEARLENLLKHTSNEHFNYIKYLGGILGFIGGLVIWNPVLALTFFGIAGVSLYVADELLFRRT